MAEWPEERLDVDAFYSPSRKEKSSVRPSIQEATEPHEGTVIEVLQKIVRRCAHFLEGGPVQFAASVFSITATKAVSLDPQQRDTLETTYRAPENVTRCVRHYKRHFSCGSFSSMVKRIL